MLPAAGKGGVAGLAVRSAVTISVWLGAACLPFWAQPKPLPDAPSSTVVRPFAVLPADGGRSACQPDSRRQESQSWSALKRGLQDQRQLYAAPFHRAAVKWDLGFLLLTGGLIASDRHISGAVSPDHLHISRDISDVGLYAATAGTGGLWLAGAATDNAHAREAGALGGEALANAAAVYLVMQVIAGRQRPLEGDQRGHFWKNHAPGSSFPSGHAIFTWSEASVIAHEYPRPWVKWLAYGTATAVSVTRFSGKEHFPADIVVGSSLGYLLGRHIFRAHCQAGLSAACPAGPRN
jgi:membrane-associated phospholipid phosphatase